MKVYCPCCGYKTLDSEREYDICPICFWEDDPIQYDEPSYEGGANHISLYMAKENYERIGACEERVLSYVRTPEEFLDRDPSWKPVKELIADYYKERINSIDSIVENCLLSDDIEEQSELRYLINALDVIEPEKARVLSLRIISEEKLSFLWPFTYRYLCKFRSEEIEDLFVRFSVDNYGKWPEIENILNEYFREVL